MGSRISSNQSCLTQYSDRFYISDHPLYSNQNIKLLHEKLTSNIFVLSILSACDLKTKQEYHKLINEKLALRATTLTQIQHYFQQLNSNACSQFYKIYVLFAINQMMTLKQYILTQKLGKKGYNYKKLDEGINYLLLAVSYLRYLNQPHSNINSTTILIDEQKFLLSDPWICPLQHFQNYPSPQKLNKINNFAQNFDQYANDIFAIGMTFLQVLSKQNVRSVYKKNNKIDMIQLKGLFDQIQKTNQNKLLNPQNIYISSLMKKLKVILFQSQKQRLKMLQNINNLHQQKTQQAQQHKGIKKTLNKLRNISESQIDGEFKPVNKLNIEKNSTSQLFRKKPLIDTILLHNMKNQQKNQLPSQELENIRLQKVNLRKPNKQIKIYEQSQNNQFGQSRDSQATVKITKQYQKPNLKNNQLKRVNSAQSMSIFVNQTSGLQNSYKPVWNHNNNETYNKENQFIYLQKHLNGKKSYHDLYQSNSRQLPKVNFKFNSPDSIVPDINTYSKYHFNFQKNISDLPKYNQTQKHFSTLSYQKYNDQNKNQNWFAKNQQNKYYDQFNRSKTNQIKLQNQSYTYKPNINQNQFQLQNINKMKVESKNSLIEESFKNLGKIVETKQTQHFNLKNSYDYNDTKDSQHKSPYFTSYLQSRQQTKSQMSKFFKNQIPFIESIFKQKTIADTQELNNNNKIFSKMDNICTTTNTDKNYRVQLDKKLCYAGSKNQQFSKDEITQFPDRKNTQFQYEKCHQVHIHNPVTKKSVWKRTLQQSLNSSNIQVEGIQTTQSIIQPFKLNYEKSTSNQQFNIKLSNFSKKYPQQIKYSEIIAEQNENQEQKTNKKIDLDLQQDKEGFINNYQNLYFNKRSTTNFSQFQQKNSLQIPEVQRKVIGLINQNYHAQHQTQYSRNKILAEGIKFGLLSPQSIVSVQSSSSKSKVGEQVSSLNIKLQSIQNKFREAMGLAADNFNNSSKNQSEDCNLSNFQSSQKKNSTSLDIYTDINNVHTNQQNKLLNQDFKSQNKKMTFKMDKNAQIKSQYYESNAPAIVNIYKNYNTLKNKPQIKIDFDEVDKILSENQKNNSSKSQSIKSQNITAICKLKSNDQQDQIKQDDQISIISKKKTKSQKDKMQETQNIHQLTKSQKILSLDDQRQVEQKENQMYQPLQNQQQFIIKNHFQSNFQKQSKLKSQQIKNVGEKNKKLSETNKMLQEKNINQTNQENKNSYLQSFTSSEYQQIQQNNRNIQQTYYTPNKLEYSSFPQLISRTIPQEQEEGSLNGSFLNQNIEPFGDYVQQQYQNGGKYCGYMFNSMRNGPGKFYYRDGGYYDGVWKNNMMNGYGKLYYDNGNLAYEGQWYKDQFHGRGKVYNDSAEQLLTQFDYRNFQNIEQYWQFYQGELSHDTKVGYGKIKLSNGEIFSGTFVNDKAHGLGRFLTLEGDVVKGIWHDGKLLKQISRQRKSHFQQNEQQYQQNTLNQQIRIQELE